MTNQIEAAIKIAAENIKLLRSSDVFRVLEQNETGLRQILADYISSSRPDLSEEVAGCLEDLA